MDNTNLNYVKEEKSKNKKLIAFILLIVAALTFVGIVAAYYSDTAEHSGSVTSSTLNIDGTYTVLLNNVETELVSITSLNPGDVIVIRGTIVNNGNQSAWIRENISFTSEDSQLLDYFKIYNAELTQEQLTPENNVTENLLTLTDGSTTNANRVINGSGSNAQTESGGGYTYINADTYNFVLTIYFMHTAPNATQGKTFNLSVTTQALQFRNNNTAEPTETAWDVVGTVG